ncbi:hypothetical protein MWH28_08320 [Natroniella sulfidigena]|uniref:hypothetical protein n=1 Tax=Natroniella sulfidigena TaxID=723921 RepID=UPI00200A4CA8|nr:hypothetical protein [Natroniella sulfidigena]MCK8817360.1 hypothetical protein [Natroniella sulfidigena]
MNLNKSFKIIVMIFLMIGILTSSAYAHRMLLDEPQNGEVQVGFDDGTVAPGAEVIMYDQDGEVIVEGAADEDGIFSYDTTIEPYRVVSTDDTGHRAEWTADVEQGFMEEAPMWMRFIFGFAIITFLAAITMFWKAKQAANN